MLLFSRWNVYKTRLFLMLKLARSARKPGQCVAKIFCWQQIRLIFFAPVFDTWITKFIEKRVPDFDEFIVECYSSVRKYAGLYACCDHAILWTPVTNIYGILISLVCVYFRDSIFRNRGCGCFILFDFIYLYTADYSFCVELLLSHCFCEITAILFPSDLWLDKYELLTRTHRLSSEWFSILWNQCWK